MKPKIVAFAAQAPSGSSSLSTASMSRLASVTLDTSMSSSLTRRSTMRAATFGILVLYKRICGAF